MNEIFQVHLAGKGLCGRALRYQLLPVDQVESIKFELGVALGNDVSIAKYRRAVAVEAWGRMIHSFTDPVAPKEIAAAKWHARPSDGLARHWAELFGTKDTETLRRIFEKEHEADEADVDAIMGKRIAVVE